MDVLPACMSVHHIVPGMNRDQKRAPNSHEVWIMDDYEEQGEGMELNLDPLEDDQYS